MVVVPGVPRPRVGVAEEEAVVGGQAWLGLHWHPNVITRVFLEFKPQ